MRREGDRLTMSDSDGTSVMFLREKSSFAPPLQGVKAEEKK